MPSKEIYYHQSEFETVLDRCGGSEFDDIWAWSKDWVEDINIRRGGWSGVSRHCLNTDTGKQIHVYLKRQENHNRRARASGYRSQPTYWFEFQTLKALKHQCPLLLSYGQRRREGKLQAFIMVASLEGYVSLEQIIDEASSEQGFERYLESIRDTVGAVHAQGFMHGCLYAKHIMLNPEDGSCRLIDFEKTSRPFNKSKIRFLDFDRLFRRTPELSKKHRELLMSEPNLQDSYKSRIKHELHKAESYTQRKQSKHEAELKLITRALKYVTGVETFLDAPCGTGRASILLARKGFVTTGVDLGDAAVTLAKEKVAQAGVAAEILKADLERLPFLDKSFAAVLCFRLYHHFPTVDIRAKIVAELCRVAGKFVLISYLSPFAFTSIKRTVRAALFNKVSKQHATSLSSIEELFAVHGFERVADIPRRRFIHTLHLAVFKRV